MNTYLNAGENKLCLAISSGAECIDRNNDYQAYRYPHSIVDFFVPVVDQDGGGGKLSGKNLG